jgi:hypothetical protein
VEPVHAIPGLEATYLGQQNGYRRKFYLHVLYLISEIG